MIPVYPSYPLPKLESEIYLISNISFAENRYFVIEAFRAFDCQIIAWVPKVISEQNYLEGRTIEEAYDNFISNKKAGAKISSVEEMKKRSHLKVYNITKRDKEFVLNIEKYDEMARKLMQ